MIRDNILFCFIFVLRHDHQTQDQNKERAQKLPKKKWMIWEGMSFKNQMWIFSN